MSKDILKESLRDINSSQTYSKGMQLFKMHNPVSKFCENLIKTREFMHLKIKTKNQCKHLKLFTVLWNPNCMHVENSACCKSCSWVWNSVQ